jgi:hypothetical protein
MIGILAAGAGIAGIAGIGAAFLGEEPSAVKAFRQRYPTPVAVPPVGSTPEVFARAREEARARDEAVEQLKRLIESETDRVAWEKLSADCAGVEAAIEANRRISAVTPEVRADAEAFKDRAEVVRQATAEMYAEGRGSPGGLLSPQAGIGWTERLARLGAPLNRSAAAKDVINAALPRELTMAAGQTGATARQLEFEAEEAERQVRIEGASLPAAAVNPRPQGSEAIRAELAVEAMKRDAARARAAATKARAKADAADREVEAARQRLMQGLCPQASVMGRLSKAEQIHKEKP